MLTWVLTNCCRFYMNNWQDNFQQARRMLSDIMPSFHIESQMSTIYFLLLPIVQPGRWYNPLLTDSKKTNTYSCLKSLTCRSVECSISSIEKKRNETQTISCCYGKATWKDILVKIKFITFFFFPFSFRSANHKEWEMDATSPLWDGCLLISILLIWYPTHDLLLSTT